MTGGSTVLFLSAKLFRENPATLAWLPVTNQDKNQIIMETEIIDLKNSYLRVLSEEVYSFHDSPPFDKSAMDGYAVIASDTFGASPNAIKKLSIIDQIGVCSAQRHKAELLRPTPMCTTFITIFNSHKPVYHHI